MTATTSGDDVVDDASGVREGRALRPNARYRIEIGDENLAYAPVVSNDPVLTGRQVIEAAGKRPVAEHLVFQMLRDGGLKELRLEDTSDLHGGGVERFLVFHSSESYRFELDGRVMEWGAAAIGEAVLRTFAGIPENYNIWQERRGGQEDLLLARDATAELAPKGLERFYTGIDQTTAGLTTSFLPERDRRYLADRGLAYEEVDQSGQKALIFGGYPLPAGAFDHVEADLLVLVPGGWPDTGTDMFYLFPWVKVARTGAYANAADQPHAFADRAWQRWSRHNEAWRRGRDGIWTVLRRVDAALRGV